MFWEVERTLLFLFAFSQCSSYRFCFQNNAWLRAETHFAHSKGLAQGQIQQQARHLTPVIQVEHHSPWQLETARKARETRKAIRLCDPCRAGLLMVRDSTRNTALSLLVPADKYQISCPDMFCHCTGDLAGSFFWVRFQCELSTAQSTHCAVWK